MLKQITWIFLGSICLLCLLKCAATPPPPATSPALSLPVDTSSVMLFAPGDEIEIKFLHTPQYNERQKVRPDGMISMPLVGEIKVTSLSPSQLQDKLTEIYQKDLINPHIQILVHSYTNMNVFVGGQVKNPGMIALNGPMSALEAIISAGGFDIKTADASKVILIRQVQNTRYVAFLNLEQAINGVPVDPIILQPRDVIIVSRTKISDLNQWVDQYINQMLPRIGFSFGLPVTKSVTVGLSH